MSNAEELLNELARKRNSPERREELVREICLSMASFIAEIDSDSRCVAAYIHQRVGSVLAKALVTDLEAVTSDGKQLPYRRRKAIRDGGGVFGSSVAGTGPPPAPTQQGAATKCSAPDCVFAQPHSPHALGEEPHDVPRWTAEEIEAAGRVARKYDAIFGDESGTGPAPEGARELLRLSDRPEVRQWLSNVIYAFMHDEPTEPIESEITSELDALEMLLTATAQPEPPREAPGDAGEPVLSKSVQRRLAAQESVPSQQAQAIYGCCLGCGTTIEAAGKPTRHLVVMCVPCQQKILATWERPGNGPG